MTTPPIIDERPAPEKALIMARQAFADFPWCFWFRAKEASLATVGGVCRVVRRLRQHGDRAAWNTAYQIEQAQKSLF